MLEQIRTYIKNNYSFFPELFREIVYERLVDKIYSVLVDHDILTLEDQESIRFVDKLILGYIEKNNILAYAEYINFKRYVGNVVDGVYAVELSEFDRDNAIKYVMANLSSRYDNNIFRMSKADDELISLYAESYLDKSKIHQDKKDDDLEAGLRHIFPDYDKFEPIEKTNKETETYSYEPTFEDKNVDSMYQRSCGVGTHANKARSSKRRIKQIINDETFKYIITMTVLISMIIGGLNLSSKLHENAQSQDSIVLSEHIVDRIADFDIDRFYSVDNENYYEARDYVISFINNTPEEYHNVAFYQVYEYPEQDTLYIMDNIFSAVKENDKTYEFHRYDCFLEYAYSFIAEHSDEDLSKYWEAIVEYKNAMKEDNKGTPFEQLSFKDRAKIMDLMDMYKKYSKKNSREFFHVTNAEKGGKAR